MKIYIKNMVCNRCKMVVRDELIKFGLHPNSVELGEVKITEQLTDVKKKELDKVLQSFGFSIIGDKKSRMIEQVKNAIIQLAHYSDIQHKVKLSVYLSEMLNRDYSYISKLFTEVEGTTIEKYFISQKIEKAKELLVYQELSLSEIGLKLGYSSVSHLSTQFKNVTGMTPSHFAQMKNKKRRPIEEL